MPVELDDREQVQIKEAESTTLLTKAEILTLLQIKNEVQELRLIEPNVFKFRQNLLEMEKWRRDTAGMKRAWFCMGFLAAWTPLFIHMMYRIIRCSPHW